MKASLPTISLLMLLLFVPVSFAQERMRRIEIKKVPRVVEPISVVEIRLGDKKITSGEEFASDDSWVGNLAVEIRNVSEKNIVWLGGMILLERQGKGPIGVAIQTTSEPFPGDFTKNNSHLLARYKLVKPNETAVIRVQPHMIDSFIKLMNDREVTAEYIQVSYDRVIFEDGTMWYSGTTLCPDLAKNGWFVNKPGLPCPPIN